MAWWKLNYNQKIIIVPEYKTADVKIFVQKEAMDADRAMCLLNWFPYKIFNLSFLIESGL